jgi:2-polyprenyl-3-methyl-5-hydroxy-6-metoxy-1,4-benzoquinol methylase
MDFHARRGSAGIETIIAKENNHNLMVYHQWHESKRDMDLAMSGVQGTDYSSVQRMREQGGLYSVYNHGHRERALDGRLEGIMSDHQTRYQWAASQLHSGKVLDLGCGTGYGSTFFKSPVQYLGLDADAESIEWARAHYSMPNILFRNGSAAPLDLPSSSVDAIVCFEVLEHVENQRIMVDEMRRVLRPGGTLFLSTPQKGATAGTPWDKYMLTAEELQNLFAGWDITLYHQLRYGHSEVRLGPPPADAEIQLLIAKP